MEVKGKIPVGWMDVQTGSLLERVHVHGHVHSGAVREECGQGRLNEQAKDRDLVPVDVYIYHNTTSVNLF